MLEWCLAYLSSSPYMFIRTSVSVDIVWSLRVELPLFGPSNEYDHPPHEKRYDDRTTLIAIGCIAWLCLHCFHLRSHYGRDSVPQPSTHQSLDHQNATTRFLEERIPPTPLHHEVSVYSLSTSATPLLNRSRRVPVLRMHHRP